MNVKEAGRLGALITNKKLTKEGRSKAAKKGWRIRKAKIAHHDSSKTSTPQKRTTSAPTGMSKD